MPRSEVDFAYELRVPTNVIARPVERKMMTQPNAVGYPVVDFPQGRRQVIL
ncbi:hypothetical protein PUN28_000102 [Cardiocondyla obscurior]|uniref:Uncharacterized protein n=1 Tax=Cardiocondyla obscurior TaxID=286306 RepID=A0AAW2GY46_9HYME